MSKRKLIVSFLMMIIAVLSSAAISLADDQIDFRQTRIARVGFIEGNANVQRQGAEDWDSAALNVPVFPGDLVYTNQNTKMELELYGGFIRLGENTSLELVKFSPKLYRFDLSVGLATFSFGEERPEIEIATPQAAVSLKKPGIYRIKVNLDGTTEVIVQEGQVELFGRTSTFKLNKDKRAIFSPTNNVAISDFDFRDEWDNWNNQRENLISVNSPNGYLKPKPYLYGSSLLNQHGKWINIANLGFVWQPANLSTNWAPYRVGRWAFYRTSGWTWISHEAWGWLPYHYGYWTYIAQYGWVWVPGDLDWFWSPALVTWYYSTWDNTRYICWHPRNNNWPGNGNGNGNGGGSDWNPTSSKLPGDRAKGKIHDDVISALPADNFLNGNASSTKGYTLNDSMKLEKTINLKDLPQPVNQGISTTVFSNNVPSSEIVSRPLVTKFGETDNQGRRKYDAPKGTIASTSSTSTVSPNSGVSDSSEHAKKTPKTIDDGPKVKAGSIGNTTVTSTNNSGSHNSSKPSASERSSQPKVSASPVSSSSSSVSSSSSSVSSSSNSSNSSGGNKGGHGGGGKSKQ